MSDANHYRIKKAPFSLLIVDGNTGHQCLMNEALKTPLYQTRSVFKDTAGDALSYLAELTNQDIPSPDLVLMDVHLPFLKEGWAFLHTLRSGYVLLPVVILSADVQADTVMKAYEEKAQAYIEKPAQVIQWKSLFENLLAYWVDTVILPRK